jgi:hypothetical protein
VGEENALISCAENVYPFPVLHPSLLVLQILQMSDDELYDKFRQGTDAEAGAEPSL